MKRLAVLGHPVAHSRSPVMHTAALAALGLNDWTYEAIDVAPDAFDETVREMAAGEFCGANVTVPHKGAALAVADSLSEVAREVGAANTLVFEGGQIRAYNTDADGFLSAIPGPVDGKRALVLGAGGAARAVVWALVREGAEVGVWNRTELRSRNLCQQLGGSVVTDPDPSTHELIVNTTAVGLHGENPFVELPLSPDSFSEGQIVADLVYGTKQTELLHVAAARGAEVVEGIEVLVRQGAVSLSIWTGRDAPIDEMRAAARGE